MKKQKNLNKQLWPLYFGYFLQYSMFWFSIEKPFMLGIGFNSTWIGVNVAVFSIVILLLEFPSGVLADKWSRKGTMILSSIALTISSIIGAFSTTILSYLLMSVFWGVFVALQSGTLEAIVYDSLIEQNGSSDRYEKEYSKLIILSSLAMILGAGIGGAIGEYIGLRDAYLYSIPISILSIFFIGNFKQPKIKKTKPSNDESYLKTVYLIITKNKKLLFLMTSLVFLSIAYAIIAEMRQLWLSALSIPIIYFGITSIISSSAYGFGSYISQFLRSSKVLAICLSSTLLSISIIIFAKNAVTVVIAHFFTMTFLYGSSIVLMHSLLNNVPASIRASSASAVNMIRQLLLIPLVILFGIIATNTSAFNATWMIFILIAFSVISLTASLFIKNKKMML